MQPTASSQDAPQDFARTPELEWLRVLQRLMMESQSPGHGSSRLSKAALEAWEQTREAYGIDADVLHRRLRQTIPEMLVSEQEGVTGPGPSQLELIERVLAPLERLVATRQHLLDERSPVAALQQYVVERMGVDATVHRFDASRLPRLVAALPRWLPRRGDARAAVALLEGVTGQRLDALIRVPEPSTAPHLKLRPDLLAFTPRREAVDAYQAIEHAGLLEAEEAPEEVPEFDAELEPDLESDLEPELEPEGETTLEMAVDSALELALEATVEVALDSEQRAALEADLTELESVSMRAPEPEPESQKVAEPEVASEWETQETLPPLDPEELSALLQMAEETRDFARGGRETSARGTSAPAAGAAPTATVQAAPEQSAPEQSAPDQSAPDAGTESSGGAWEGLGGHPSEVLMSHPLSWYGHRHDKQTLVSTPPVLSGGVARLEPSLTARFPLAREDVLISAIEAREVLAPLLRLLPVWANLRVHLHHLPGHSSPGHSSLGQPSPGHSAGDVR